MKTLNHVQMVMRAECEKAPVSGSDQILNSKVEQLILDIGMQILFPARSIWVGVKGNEGYTTTAALETSHYAIHFWDHPDQEIMTYKNSILAQKDLYTCGCLGEEEVKTILRFMEEYKPLRVECMLFDRSKTIVTMPIVHVVYDAKDGVEYNEFIDKLVL